MDSIENEEDITPGALDEIEDPETSSNDEVVPNNNFCHNESDFVPEMQSNINEVLRHQQRNRNAWLAIEELEGKEVIVGSGAGTISWTVVRGSFHSDLQKEVEEQQDLYEKSELTFLDPFPDTILGIFQRLWPSDNFWDDLNILNESITKMNMIRKKKFQKPIKVVSKPEYLRFLAIFIVASQYKKKGGVPLG